MKRLEVSGAVRPIYGSLGVKELILVKSTSVFSVQWELNFITEHTSYSDKHNDSYI